uniref:Uncharacterized protein n=1 Tax=Arundo donax TaxID=35708 RepID=A0A0A9BCA1_ARUDO
MPPPRRGACSPVRGARPPWPRPCRRHQGVPASCEGNNSMVEFGRRGSPSRAAPSSSEGGWAGPTGFATSGRWG